MNTTKVQKITWELRFPLEVLLTKEDYRWINRKGENMS
jgi:hypothetical protein